MDKANVEYTIHNPRLIVGVALADETDYILVPQAQKNFHIIYSTL